VTGADDGDGDEAASAPHGVAAMPDRSPLRGRRLLLVEDNEINRELAVELLADAGIVVDVAANGIEALHRLDGEPYDVVLMDCQMPVMDGYATTALLRADPRFRAVVA